MTEGQVAAPARGPGAEPVLGVDGCPGGWVGALVATDGNGVEWELFADVDGVVSAGAAVVGIDIPMGLAEDDARECDIEARRLLRPYGSRVFPAPIRSVTELAAASYADACAASRSRHARRRALSRQTWNILGKIREVDGVVTPELQGRVIEVHPEVSFATLAGGPLTGKRTRAGRAERLGALRGWLRDPGEALARAPRPARFDDALDALAVAWTARRWRDRAALILPCDDPPRDARGLRMQIVV